MGNKIFFTYLFFTVFTKALISSEQVQDYKSTVTDYHVHATSSTALDRYIQKPDPAFNFSLVSTTKLAGVTIQVLDFTSQSWRSKKEVNHNTWKHWLTIIRPDKVDYSTGLLYITGGSNSDKIPTQFDENLIKIAKLSNSVVAELRMVPNQPLVFSDEHDFLKEDSFIAYTWNKFLKGGDHEWPARLPMTKSVVRAMDAVTQFCRTNEGGAIKIEKFVVSGESKRGWTAWTTAAVDTRVVAIVPIVIDVLNIDKFSEHLYQAYGFWSPADAVYTKIGIHDLVGSLRYKELMQIEEPYEYRDRITVPKFIINSAGDQYYPPDSSQFYWDNLKGPKYLRYIPNTNHSLRGSDVFESLLYFYKTFIRGELMPLYAWSFENNGSIKVVTKTHPAMIKVWSAFNPHARDFRLDKIGPAYKSHSAIDMHNGVYVGEIEPPKSGWAAFFLELKWEMPSGAKITMTTAVRILPDILPYKAYGSP